MEEGKRMFSIFAARMFEQRVLQAYREKVAQERQLQLLRELDDEDKLSKEREAKKQSQNQKKKDKKRYSFLRHHRTADSNILIRLQKQLKEEERAQKAAEKAAEEAAVKAKQAAIEEEAKKKKEEERVKREAARRAQEEERTRREEEKKRRQQEDREREQERERKRKEKEEKAKAERREREERERKEREEKERKAKEERERKEKEDKERAEKTRLEKVKIEKEKAEREAKERQQRASSSAVAGPSTSNGKSTNRGPRNGNGANAAASSSSSSVSPRPASSATTPTKRILNKPQVISVSTSSPAIIGTSVRQHPPHQQQSTTQTPSRGPPQLSSQPATPISPHVSTHMPPPPQTPNLMFSQGQGIIPSSTMSPRMPSFPPMSFPFGAPGLQQQQPGGPPLPPSIGRGFNPAPGAFDPPFPRVSIGGNVNMMNGGVPPSPIGPPPKSKTPLASSSTMPLAPGSGRRSSVPVHAEAGPGPVARPQVAPIARPGTGVTSGSGEAGSSTSGSPRRSPSPKGILGSSALAADDDEVVPSGNRRGASTAPIGLGPVGTGVSGGGNAGPNVMGVGSGQGWVSPSRPDGLGIRSPWGPPPGFGVAPGRPQTTAPQQQQQPHPPIGPPGGVGHHPPPPHHHQGMSGPIPHPAPVPPPLGGASLWASVPTPGSAPDWNAPASFFAGHPSFLNNQNTSPPPHSAS